MRPVSSATFFIFSASSRVKAMGFSTKTSLPACMAWIANSAWVSAGVPGQRPEFDHSSAHHPSYRLFRHQEQWNGQWLVRSPWHRPQEEEHPKHENFGRGFCPSTRNLPGNLWYSTQTCTSLSQCWLSIYH